MVSAEAGDVHDRIRGRNVTVTGGFRSRITIARDQSCRNVQYGGGAADTSYVVGTHTGCVGGRSRRIGRARCLCKSRGECARKTVKCSGLPETVADRFRRPDAGRGTSRMFSARAGCVCGVSRNGMDAIGARTSHPGVWSGRPAPPRIWRSACVCHRTRRQAQSSRLPTLSPRASCLSAVSIPNAEASTRLLSGWSNSSWI